MSTRELQLRLLAAYQQLLSLFVTVTPGTVATAIYTEASKCLDTHITLNSAVPPDLGCAEAVSFVLKNAGVEGIPVAGFAGTAALYAWLNKSSSWVLTSTPVPGDIVISPTGMSSIGSEHGHVAVYAKYGLLSNDSDTGLFLEKYTMTSWNKYFGTTLGFPTYVFHFI